MGFVFVWLFLGGSAHSVATEPEMRIVLPWIPWPGAAVPVESSANTLEEAHVDEILNAWIRTGRVPLPLFRSLR